MVVVYSRRAVEGAANRSTHNSAVRGDLSVWFSSGSVGDRNVGGYECAQTGAGAHLDVPSDRAESVAHVLQSDAVLRASEIETATVVAHLEVELVILDL